MVKQQSSYGSQHSRVEWGSSSIECLAHGVPVRLDVPHSTCSACNRKTTGCGCSWLDGQYDRSSGLQVCMLQALNPYPMIFIVSLQVRFWCDYQC